MESSNECNLINFTNSLMEFVDLLLKKSKEENIEILDPLLKQNKKKCDQHAKLRDSCAILKNVFSESVDNVNEKESDFKSKNQVEIIKKVYRKMTDNINYLHPEQNMDLFTLKDDKNSIITILPGIDIGLVTKKLTENEKNLLWGHLFMMYISAAELIARISKHKKEGKKWDIINKLKDKVVEFGIIPDKIFFINPFLGINTDDSNKEIDTSTMYSNLDQIKKPEGGVKGMLQMSGVDKMFDMKKISAQLENISEDEINTARDQITKMIGAEGDSDTSQLLGSLVGDVVNKLKQGGDLNVFDIAESVAQDNETKHDPNKFMKTAKQVQNFMSKGEQNLKNLKDDKGNPIGNDLFKSLQNPLQFMKNLNPNMAADLEKVTAKMNNLKTQNNNKPNLDNSNISQKSDTKSDTKSNNSYNKPTKKNNKK
jgi:hypothetical protein